MRDQDKTREQLNAELDELRRQLAAQPDLAERKQAEREAAKHRAMLQATIDCLPFSFFAMGLDGRYMMQSTVSKTQHRLNVVGKRPEEVCSNEHDLAIWRENNRRAFAGEKVEGEVTLSLSGEERCYYNVVVPVSDDTEMYGILGVNIDITQRKQAEAALKQANDELERRVAERTAALTRANEELALFRKFAETSGQGFSMADLDGRITYVNPAMCRMLGETKPEDVVGRHLSKHFSDQTNRRGKEEIEPALKEHGHWEGELPMVSRRGTVVPTWHNTFIIADERGQPLQVAVVVTDITERKRADEALQREHRTLEHMLKASDHERQLIAYDIHDGLAQELAGAMMQFQVYEHLKDTQPDEARRAYEGGVTLLRQGHAEARRLISGVRPPILDESGVMAAISHLVHDPLFESGPKIDFRSRVTFRRLAPVVENVVYRIVQEGLANARAHSQSKKIVVSLVQRGDRLRIEIRDWGIGFVPKANQENRFGIEGIRERARLLGGKFAIRSKPGKGTSILVELPVVDREPPS